MSPGDTAWTIAGFVVVGFGVLAVFGIAPFLLMMGDSSQGKQYATLEGFLVVAAAVGPPLVISGIYVTAIMLALRASGSTAHYPWIVLAVGALVWFAIVGLAGYVKGNLMYWLPRAKGEVADETLWTGTPLTSAQALAALGQWATEQGRDTPIAGLRADRFPYGWTIYAPLPTAPGDPQAVLDSVDTEPVYLVGDSGSVAALTSGDLHDIRTRFCRDEIRRRRRS